MINFLNYLGELSKSTSSPDFCSRHGSVLTISSILRHKPSRLCGCTLFSEILDCLKVSLYDEKFAVHETSTKALRRLLIHQTLSEPLITNAYSKIIPSIVSAMHDDSSEVRRRALSVSKSVAKANPTVTMTYITVFNPSLADCLMDSSTPVRLAAETEMCIACLPINKRDRQYSDVTEIHNRLGW